MIMINDDKEDDLINRRKRERERERVLTVHDVD